MTKDTIPEGWMNDEGSLQEVIVIECLLCQSLLPTVLQAPARRAANALVSPDDPTTTTVTPVSKTFLSLIPLEDLALKTALLIRTKRHDTFLKKIIFGCWQ